MKNIRLILIVAILVVLANCKKSNDDEPVTIHCSNLINQPIPPGDPGKIYVPNAFTPNGDGLNDQFRALTTQIATFQMKIYDKKSNVVFETTQIGKGWNPGSQTANQTFYFRVEGSTLSDTKIGLCGEISLLVCVPKDRTLGSYTFEDMITANGFTGVTSEPIKQCN